MVYSPNTVQPKAITTMEKISMRFLLKVISVHNEVDWRCVGRRDLVPSQNRSASIMAARRSTNTCYMNGQAATHSSTKHLSSCYALDSKVLGKLGQSNRSVFGFVP